MIYLESLFLLIKLLYSLFSFIIRIFLLYKWSKYLFIYSDYYLYFYYKIINLYLVSSNFLLLFLYKEILLLIVVYDNFYLELINEVDFIN